MKRIKAALCVVTVLVFAAALAAQNPSTDPAPAQPKQKQQATETAKPNATEDEAGKTKSVTLTGCLQAGTDPNTFTLTSVGSGAGKAKGKENEPAATPDTYQLSPASGVDLKAHVGHKITITGTMATGTELARTEPGAAGGEKRVEVKTVKHVSPTCP